MRAIHATGLVRRDLKPANVLLASDGPRVIDFGISRAVTDSRLTATGSIMGTPAYMSPEQVEGKAAGPPSDVFSLGSVLAFAACGVPAFNAPDGSSAAVMYRVVHGSPDLGTVPAELRELVQACLAKEAGVLALATQLNGGQNIGPVNPVLYSTLGPAGADDGISDVVSGNNSVLNPSTGAVLVPGFTAGPGFDVASGWGTINAKLFVPALVT